MVCCATGEEMEIIYISNACIMSGGYLPILNFLDVFVFFLI
jgi:hypothetical protein